MKLKKCCQTTVKSYARSSYTHPSNKLRERDFVYCNRCDYHVPVEIILNQRVMLAAEKERPP